MLSRVWKPDVTLAHVFEIVILVCVEKELLQVIFRVLLFESPV